MITVNVFYIKHDSFIMSLFFSAVTVSFQQAKYNFMERDSNSEEYIIVEIDGQTSVPLLDSFDITFTDGNAASEIKYKKEINRIVSHIPS